MGLIGVFPEKVRAGVGAERTAGGNEITGVTVYQG